MSLKNQQPLNLESLPTLEPALELLDLFHTLPSGFIARMDCACRRLFALNITAHSALVALQHGCDLETLADRMTAQLGELVSQDLVIHCALALSKAGLVSCSCQNLLSQDSSLLTLLPTHSSHSIPVVHVIEIDLTCSSTTEPALP
jgi:hypothetical protein